MSTWTPEELDTPAAATELRISTWRADGTLRPAVPIWVVRSYRGPEGRWFQRAAAGGSAHIQAGTITSEVAVTPAGAMARAPRSTGSAAPSTPASAAPRRPDDRRPRGRDDAPAHPVTLKGH